MSDSHAQLRLYLARHGQTDWNKAQRMQGSSDIALNATGRAQAAALAERLAGVHLDAIYCSTLQRSRTTAEALAGRASIEALDGLREQSLGKFEGLLMEGSDVAARDEFLQRVRDPRDSLDGGESYVQHRVRVEAALNSLLARHPSGTILVVGHGGTNAIILRTLLRLDGKQAQRIRQGNDELYLLELSGKVPPRLFKHIPIDRLEEL